VKKTNRSRSTNLTQRRSSGQMQWLRKIIYEVLEEDHPMTVRQTFYRLVSLGVIAKTENEYKQTVIRLLTQMRRERVIP
jgi:DNA topoisomerase VI subunit A